MNEMIERIKTLRNCKGFTLVELIIVIMVVGILATILIPKFAGFSVKAHATQALVDAKQIATAIDALKSEGKTPVETDNGNVETMSGVDLGNKLDIADPASDGYFTYTVNGYTAERTAANGNVVKLQ